MDISNNYIEDMDDLPELIPIEPLSTPTDAHSPFFANILHQFQQQIPYTMSRDILSLQTGQIPIFSPISRRYFPVNTQVVDVQDISAAAAVLQPLTTPSLFTFPHPVFTTQTFPTTGNLSSIMERSFQEKPRYKQVLSDKGEEQITYKKYTKEDDTNAICAITREEFSIGDDIAILPCDHVFCKEAINQWLQTKKAECPICRFKLESKEVKEELENTATSRTMEMPRPHRMRQMLFDLINHSIDAEEDEAVQRAIIASLQEIN